MEINEQQFFAEESSMPTWDRSSFRFPLFSAIVRQRYDTYAYHSSESFA